MPAQAKANGMELDDEFDELKCTRTKVDSIVCTLYENGSIANWKAKVYTWPSS